MIFIFAVAAENSWSFNDTVIIIIWRTTNNAIFLYIFFFFSSSRSIRCECVWYDKSEKKRLKTRTTASATEPEKMLKKFSTKKRERKNINKTLMVYLYVDVGHNSHNIPKTERQTTFCDRQISVEKKAHSCHSKP